MAVVSLAQKIIIFGVDNSSSVHADNYKKVIPIFGKDPIVGLYDIH